MAHPSEHRDLSRALALVDAIVRDVEAWSKTPEARLPAGDDEEEARDLAAHVADYTARFGGELEAVGVARYLAAAFVRLDMDKRADPGSVTFFWQPRIAWSDVLEIACCLADHREAVYHFAWFAWEQLGLDVRALAEHVEIPELVAHELRGWSGSAYAVLEDRWVRSDEPCRLQRTQVEARLHAQGAPMLRGA
jgi:hypothetical protein